MAKLSGAIFDCDGTLVDSMQMWFGVFDRLLEGHGEKATPELQARLEPMTMPDACRMLHEEYGLGESAQEVSDELDRIVSVEYAEHVREMPGAHAFVESLARAGIPMIIASSTKSKLVRGALEAHGLLGYFTDVLCTSEVRDGRDKIFPDVYLEALDRLCTPLGETWVFEDAPFGIRTARRAGFHVVGIHNDHDGRDEGFVRAWSDIFSENYDSVSLAAIRAFDDARRRPMPEE